MTEGGATQATGKAPASHYSKPPAPNAAGRARAHLQTWVAAAAVVTRAAKAWLFRRAVAHMLREARDTKAAAVVVQAAWRGRAARAALARRAAAAAAIQRGWRAARATGRRARAAAAIQAGWKGHKARRQYARMRRCAGARLWQLCLAPHGWEERRRLLQRNLGGLRLGLLPHAASPGITHLLCAARRREHARRVRCATAAQAIRRGSAARRDFQGLRAAAVCVQSLSRARLAAKRLAALRAAELARRRAAAAAAIQAAWRGHVQRERWAPRPWCAPAASRLQRCWTALGAVLLAFKIICVIQLIS